jgi:hypothetical protein
LFFADYRFSFSVFRLTALLLAPSSGGAVQTWVEVARRKPSLLLAQFVLRAPMRTVRRKDRTTALAPGYIAP